MRSSSIVFAGVLLLASGSALAQQRGATPAAAALAGFNHGVEQYDHHDYQAALTSFRASYEAVPSPNSRLYVARCLRELGDLGGALNEFQATADDAGRRAQAEPRYAQTREAARGELAELTTRLGRVRVDRAGLPSDAHVRIDGREVAADALAEPVVVAPGHISVSVEASGYEPYSSTIEVAAGAESPVHVAMVRSHGATAVAVAPSHGTLELNPMPRNLALIAGGVAVLGWVGFISFGVAANGTYADVMQRCGTGPCTVADRDLVASGRTYDTLANVSLGLGIAGLVAGGALLVWSIRTGTHHDVAVGVNGTALTLGGRF